MLVNDNNQVFKQS